MYRSILYSRVGGVYQNIVIIIMAWVSREKAHGHCFHLCPVCTVRVYPTDVQVKGYGGGESTFPLPSPQLAAGTPQ